MPVAQTVTHRPAAPDPLDFTGKTVWVTGAGRGIGREVALQFVERGANVVGFDLQFEKTDVTTSPLEALAQSKEQSSEKERGTLINVELDISDESAVDKQVSRLLKESSALDILVNAAGILRMGAVEDTSLDDFKKCFDVNAGGVFLMLRSTIPHFKKQKSGCIVTISSNAAKVPRANMAAYCASKAALSALNNTAALELAPYGVRCNLVCPGSTDTPMQRMLWTSDDAESKTIQGFPEQYKLGIPLGKIAQPSEIAQTVLFFASPMASHITMQDVVVDGGATLNA
ncbi:2,3-dihydro-2,3-dihydroxybenzoate dehydrogenase [Marinomonas mediterranea]|uniref:2,3-dihydro-2,3-dihydroxybenzoate dehydrogenase n=1 Tax=Marinomonas mediterranea TaxID=119864 RepID=UPI00234BE7C4|nr:2,3-dihydro-2,3-dihydroxybenzoate dehydrogenase [Marinomonas mediterranea]WCN14062.1 2,3-dihydro-2,3-dihydroxybenzoate dehydrogenase [Marinomonas mediterranea]